LLCFFGFHVCGGKRRGGVSSPSKLPLLLIR
jgi:hypothetical protein